MENMIFYVAASEAEYNKVIELYAPITQTGENPIFGIIVPEFEYEAWSGDFYIIPDTYNNLEDFKQDYYYKTITIDNMQKYQ
jgi:hypothetical protein